MTWPSIFQYAFFLLVVTLLVKPLGGYLYRVFAGERTLLDPILRPAERVIYRLCGVEAGREMNWKAYALAFVQFTAFGIILLFSILKLQQHLPWFDQVNPTTPMTNDLAGNTAVSFATTTTWQAYAGETTMSYFSQMVGLTAQGFLAGGAGLAVGIAFVRGFARHEVNELGNFWVDLVRGLLWVILPAAIVGALFLVWRGVPANLNDYAVVTTLSGETQVIAQGPVFALEFIKNLGTNGGGFFNVNGAHPYANPTPLTNVVGMLAIVVIPAALTNTFGRMVRRPRQGWLLFWVMAILFSAGLLLGGWAEQDGNPRLTAAGADQSTEVADEAAPGGNMEGKETRFGIGGSILTAVTTSNTSTGSYNSMHDSYTPLGGMVPLVNMLLGEMIFGGLGGGLYSFLFVAMLGLFLSGLMIGRTPEYLGKRLGPRETRVIALYAIASSVAILIPTAIAVVTSDGLAGLTTNTGEHGLTEIFYAYASSFTNNGQNFAGLSANSPFYNWTTVFSMLVGRFGLGIAALGLAGLLVRQSRRSPAPGAMQTDSPTFGVIVIGTALVVGGLNYFPTLALGPIIEHFSL